MCVIATPHPHEQSSQIPEYLPNLNQKRHATCLNGASHIIRAQACTQTTWELFVHRPHPPHHLCTGVCSDIPRPSCYVDIYRTKHKKWHLSDYPYSNVSHLVKTYAHRREYRPHFICSSLEPARALLEPYQRVGQIL